MKETLFRFHRSHDGSTHNKLKSKCSAFGKRIESPFESISLQTEKLNAILAELTLLFQDIAFPKEPLPFAMHSGDRPVIVIHPLAHIWIDAATGLFVFVDGGPSATSTFTTPSTERLLDVVLSYLAKGSSAGVSDRSVALIEKCVGSRLAEVERALILSTLRRCGGSRPLTADLLGISMAALRSKLRSFWKEQPL